MTLVVNDPTRNEGEDYYKIEFNDLIITSFESGATSTDGKPTESVSFNYTKITWTYLPADGSEPVVVTRDFSPDPS
jgi:type VI protein secretion system component Hcp